MDTANFVFLPTGKIHVLMEPSLLISRLPWAIPGSCLKLCTEVKILKKISTFLCVCLLASGFMALAQNDEAFDGLREKTAAFEMREDGTVSVEGQEFSSMEAYHRSAKFRYENRRCASLEKALQHGLGQSSSKAASDCSNSQTVIQGEYYGQNITIPVVFHILSDSNGNGDIADALIISQVEILNEDFRAQNGTPGSAGFDTGVSFELAGITRHSNNQWFNDRRESQYKSSTGWDRDTYLNIWTNTASGYLGYAYYPDGSAGTNLDGVVLNYTAVGRNAPNGGIYNQGRTATHEVGHYLGLAHTFQGGCGTAGQPYTTGDLIADTNPESTQQFDCVERVTCNTPDPIHNYMDYTPDTCMTNFTPEQGNRVVCSLNNYRPNLGGTVTPGGISLSASGYKNKGKNVVDLTWSGATGNDVDIYRDGVLLATTANDGAYTDATGTKGGQSFSYEVCEAGTATCSSAVTVNF